MLAGEYAAENGAGEDTVGLRFAAERDREKQKT